MRDGVSLPIGSYILRDFGSFGRWVLALSGRPTYARLRFFRMEVAFAYTRIQIRPGLSLASPALAPHRCCCSVVFFVRSSLSLVYV